MGCQALFRAEYENASRLKYAIQALSKIGIDAEVSAKPEGLGLTVISPDKVMMAIVEVPLSAFIDYQLDDTYAFIVPADQLNNIFKRATRNDRVILEYEPELGNLRLTMVDKKTEVARTFELRALPSTGGLGEPKYRGYSVRLVLGATDFKQYVSDARAIGASDLLFKTDGEKLVLEAFSEPYSYTAILEKGNPLIDIDIKEDINMSFMLSSLQAAAKPATASEEMIIELGTAAPMKILYRFKGPETMTVWISPVQ